jgi:hypothetical protein
MSVTQWYHRRAEQCARLANVTADLRRRAELENERNLWLEIAAAIEKDVESKKDDESAGS